MRRAKYLLFESLGYALCELAFKTDCWGPFAYAYRAGCWCYGKAEDFVAPSPDPRIILHEDGFRG
jgi:hypothetical protein